MTKTKIIVGVSIFLFWVVVTALATTSLLLYQKNKGVFNPSSDINTLLGIGNTTTTTTTGSEPKGGAVLTAAEVGKHNNQGSCWIIVGKKVYDVTALITSHSGGAGAILDACGRDATNDFLTKNGSGSHTRSDAQMLGSYYIGDIGTSVSTAQTISTSKKTGTNSAVTNNTTGTNTPPINTNNNQTSNIALTTAEVAKHNTQASCWMIISGKVYDISNFFGSHPGGDPTLASSCGTDATVAFNTRGGTGTHSQTANAMLAQFYIGNLNATVTTNSTSNNGSGQSITPPPFTGGGRGGDDD